MEAQEHYKKAIIKNNDKQNAVQGLSVRGFSQELFHKKMDPEDNHSMTVEDYFFTSPAVISIENTFGTEESGRFIFIVLKESFHEVRAFLQDFCSKKFKEIYLTQDERDNYRVTYKSLPHLQLSPNAGGAVAKLTARIIQKLDEEERLTGIKLATTQTDTWASRVTPRFSFDKNSPHPNAKQKPKVAAVTPTSNTSVSQSVPANENASINSGSTLANGTSGQTVVSQDLSSVVSQLQSQASEQSRMFKEMMEKQDKRDRRAARVQKQMMTMILTMMKNNQASVPSKKKKKYKQTKKKSQNTLRKQNGSHEPTDDEEERDITSADDDLGSAGETETEYGDKGEMGPFFNNSGDEGGDDDESDSDEDSHSSGDEGSSGSSDGSSDESDDDDSVKTATTKNRVKRNKKTKEVKNNQDQQKITTSEIEHTGEASATNRDQKEATGTTIGTGLVPTFLRQRKRSGKANMTKEEALAHTQARVEANQKEQSDRDERKRQMGIPTDLPTMSSDDEIMSTPPKSRSRLRSPGNTPDNETKMQRTSTAPIKPTTQDEIARALDYSSNIDEPQETTIIGNRRRRGKQEK
jgi:hypothetical protein